MKEENYEEIKELVEIMVEESIHNPTDYCSNFIYSQYPESIHILFEHPGIFLDKYGRKVYREDGTELELDVAELVGPDDFITQKSTINVEYQTTPLERGKIDAIFDYKLYLIHKTNLPSLSVVISNLERGKKMKCYESRNNIFNVLHIGKGEEEDVRKKINILKNKIESEEEISEIEGLYFSYIAIFVKPHIRKKVMEELSHIFKEIEIRDHNLRLNTHHVLKVMIKATFKDDEEKTRELLTMITQGLNKEDYSKLSIFERMAEEIRVKDEINDNNINIIFNKNNEISDLHEELSNLRKENEELKLQLKNQNTGG
ncbi:hypothetical protein [Methanobrevibacter millerae]|uniref:PD-(D/E)XK nuclease family transposase n=1 Tax=Methanobrevibacter millerae TaxID=230361 RepID=A0A1G5V3D9_9EURY|nr:hypothetical protein [Methanobrevibacter millerae]SDA40383.1 hypothetical protein SAMN02910315_00331 [Methanobrevibacter millerae]